jgi:F-type H+-transporting ATPase subunit a
MAVSSGEGFMIPLEFFGVDISITTPVVVMWCVSFFIFSFLLIANRKSSFRRVETFVFGFVSESFGSNLDTKKPLWFSFLLTLFLFVFFNNLAGLIPGGSSPMGDINVTASLAILIFLISQVAGFWNHGFAHIAHLVPSGVPWPLIPFIFVLEVISQFAKPFSLAIRLFANLFAGHAVLGIFLSLVVMAPHVVKVAPFFGVMMLSFFEIFVSFIQAFIFTYLASFYISDTIKGAH